MNPNIPAIETVYNNTRFRSRTEAKWAVFFDAMQVRYEYEPQGVDLRSGPYLPDFWLPDQNAWVEAKGAWDAVGKPEITKALQLTAVSGSVVVIAIGQPAASEFNLLVLSPREFECEGFRYGATIAGEPGFLSTYRYRFVRINGGLGLQGNGAPSFGPTYGVTNTLDGGDPESPDLATCDAELQSAAFARFEHGERGAWKGPRR